MDFRRGEAGAAMFRRESDRAMINYLGRIVLVIYTEYTGSRERAAWLCRNECYHFTTENQWRNAMRMDGTCASFEFLHRIKAVCAEERLPV